jgi:hypothetical protein
MTSCLVLLPWSPLLSSWKVKGILAFLGDNVTSSPWFTCFQKTSCARSGEMPVCKVCLVSVRILLPGCSGLSCKSWRTGTFLTLPQAVLCEGWTLHSRVSLLSCTRVGDPGFSKECVSFMRAVGFIAMKF